MGREHVNICLEPDVVEALRSMNVNRSELVNEFLKGFILNRSYKSEYRPKITELEQVVKNGFEQLKQVQDNIIKAKTELEILKGEEMKEQKEQKEIEMNNLCSICGQPVDMRELHNRMLVTIIDSRTGTIAHRHCYLSMPTEKWKHIYKKAEPLVQATENLTNDEPQQDSKDKDSNST